MFRQGRVAEVVERRCIDDWDVGSRLPIEHEARPLRIGDTMRPKLPKVLGLRFVFGIVPVADVHQAESFAHVLLSPVHEPCDGPIASVDAEQTLSLSVADMQGVRQGIVRT